LSSLLYEVDSDERFLGRLRWEDLGSFCRWKTARVDSMFERELISRIWVWFVDGSGVDDCTVDMEA
jgi:hypothetical protein